MKVIPRKGVDRLMVYEPGRPLEEVARELGLDPDGLHKLASNENLLGPSPRAVEAMQEAASSMHIYPDGGCFYLKQSMSRHLDVDPERIVLGNGSNELIELLGHVFLEPGTSIVMSECAFIIYKLVADMFGAETVMVPQQDYTHDLDAMRAACTPSTRLVFISNPNNPTGTMVSGDALKKFITELPGEILVVIDEAYIELLPPAQQPDTRALLHQQENVCLLRTFSKAYGLAGLRLGYALASPALAALLNRVRQPFNVNAMAQVAAMAALEDADHLAASCAMVQEGLRHLSGLSKELGLDVVPSVTNFMLVRTGRGREVFLELQSKGIIVRPMDGYGLPEYVRITVGGPAAQQALQDVLPQVVSRAV